MPYKAEGNVKTAKIIFVAEAPARNEMLLGRPLVGPSGKIFDVSLTKANILRRDCYITNVFDFPVGKTKKNDIIGRNDELLWSHKGFFTEDGMEYVKRLVEEIKDASANLIVTMGAVSTIALLGPSKKAITKVRGSLYESNVNGLVGKKVMPTFHPASVLHGQFNWRYMIDWDFKRAKRELESPKLPTPFRQFKILPTFDETIKFLKKLNDDCPEMVSVDIEITHRQVSIVGFGLSHSEAWAIDFFNRTLEQETEIWKHIAAVLENPKIGKLFQNAMFDIAFLMTQTGIITRGRVDDTMIAHHIMYPDLPKGMAFLQSIYTNQPYHKDMVSHSGSIEKAEG